jgi:hypothetical protein
MKQQMKSLTELAATLEANAAAMFDYVVPSHSVSMNDDATITVPGALDQSLATDGGHRQIAEYTGIPAAYYDRLRTEDKPLLAKNVNRWMDDKGNERRMIRTLNGNVRALLSDRYQRIDNKEVAEVALNVLSDQRGLRVVSSAITESRLYIKAVSNDIVMPVPGSRRVGDLVEAGVMIRNSEVGSGSLSITPFAHFLICTNGMVRDKSGMRKAHIGRKIDMDIEGILSDSTRRLEDELVLRKVRDVLANAFNEQSFRKFIDGLTETTQQEITGDVNAAVEALGPTLGLQIGERQSVLRHLITGGDLSRYALINAVTRTAEDVPSYDRATELETLGYRLMELPQREWSAIANAKPLQLA